MFVFLLSSACTTEPLVEGLDQHDTLEILELLITSGIDAEKRGSSGSARQQAFDVHVPRADRERAYQTLVSHHLPRARRKDLADLSGQSIVPSATAELSKQKAGIEGSLTNELRRLPGVLDAIVQVSIPPPEVLPDETRPIPRPSATVVLIFRPTKSGEPVVPTEAVRGLVRASLPSLRASDVEVFLVPNPEVTPAEARLSRFLGLEVPEASRARLQTMLVLATVFSALVAGLAVLAALRALRYREELTRVTASQR
ncbi:MAG: hypothetical protein HY791_22785 [Deltaproteobacteria bacterium]|nr:hypothetical protein [Deltaproteobacteria bacterium]